MVQQTLTILIGGVGVVWYYACLVVVGMQWSVAPENASFRDFMSLSITTIGVALATFVGVLLGFRVVSDQVTQGVRQGTPTDETKNLSRIATSNKGSFMQWGVAVLYVVSLLLAVCFWWLKGDKADPAIINLGKSLLGLVGGALSVLLNVPQS
jgi:hypothetical protein